MPDSKLPDATLVVLDTNVFVAAGFRPRSASGEILDLARAGHIRLAWNAETRAETRGVLARIPRLDEGGAEALFDRGMEFPVSPADRTYDIVPDPADRKFAALARRAEAVLVSSDSDLLTVRDRLPVRILKPREWLTETAGQPGGDRAPGMV